MNKIQRLQKEVSEAEYLYIHKGNEEARYRLMADLKALSGEMAKLKTAISFTNWTRYRAILPIMTSQLKRLADFT